jgi:hypothetical protein
MILHFLITAWHAVVHIATHLAHLVGSGNGMEWE